MTGESKDIKSEKTKDMTQELLEGLREKTASVTEGELREFRSGFDADGMGFYGEEGQ